MQFINMFSHFHCVSNSGYANSLFFFDLSLDSLPLHVSARNWNLNTAKKREKKRENLRYSRESMTKNKCLTHKLNRIIINLCRTKEISNETEWNETKSKSMKSSSSNSKIEWQARNNMKKKFSFAKEKERMRRRWQKATKMPTSRKYHENNISAKKEKNCFTHVQTRSKRVRARVHWNCVRLNDHFLPFRRSHTSEWSLSCVVIVNFCRPLLHHRISSSR